MGRGLATELLLRKDGGKVGYIEVTRTCVGMEVRMCTGGGQPRKRAECSTSCGTGQAPLFIAQSSFSTVLQGLVLESPTPICCSLAGPPIGVLHGECCLPANSQASSHV